MKKNFLLILLVPALIGCNSNSKNKVFKDAIDLGPLGTENVYNAITFANDNAISGTAYFYKVEITEKIKFDTEEYRAFSITVYDTKEHYDDFSMPVDIVIYSSDYKKIPTITFGDYMVKYDGYSRDTTGTAGCGSVLIEGDVDPGIYYFSITPKENLQFGHYDGWVADSLGD